MTGSRHVDANPRSPVRVCSIRRRGTRHTCSLPRNHDGPHISRGLFGRTVAEWESSATAAGPSVRRGQVRKGRNAGLGNTRPTELRTSNPANVFTVPWSRLVGATPPIDQLVFLIFLIAFIGFAIQWALALG